MRFILIRNGRKKRLFTDWLLPLEYKWVVLTVTIVGIFMATLDSNILVVGLPQVVQALHTNLVVGVWFITIYRLVITVLLVATGRIADIYGRVRFTTGGFDIRTWFTSLGIVNDGSRTPIIQTSSRIRRGATVR